MSSAILSHYIHAHRICRRCGNPFGVHTEIPSGVSYIIVCPLIQKDVLSSSVQRELVQGTLPFDGDQLRLSFD